MKLDMNDPEVKAAIEKMIEEATEGLKTKNQELIGKLKKATKDAQIDPAEHQALQNDLEQTQAKLAETTKALKASTGEVDKLKKAFESESGFSSKLLIENGLNDALIKEGVKPEMSKAVKALLSGQVTIKIDGDKRTPVIGDKALSDFVTEWAKSDEGKHFVSAPNNQGGGALGGGNGKDGVKTMTRVAFDALSPEKKVEASKAGVTLTD